ncbi:hypothetical protein BC832DRAFT_301469 [Gaertneriomyces semiglobifer]|nr:hypothetical protein BC832DRAFT_301469 [Gaertneriomyces semiglobifer]
MTERTREPQRHLRSRGPLAFALLATGYGTLSPSTPLSHFDAHCQKSGDVVELDYTGSYSKPLHLHGLAVWAPSDPDTIEDAATDNSTIHLFLINHQDPSSVVTRFTHSLATTTLTNPTTFAHPLIRTPNNVFPVAADRFFVTNDHWYRWGVGRKIEDFGAMEWGSVVFVNGEQQKDVPPRRQHGGETVVLPNARVVADAISSANGITGELSSRDDGKHYLYVNAVTGLSMHTFEILDLHTGELKKLSTTYVAFLNDNVNRNADGTLTIAGHTSALQFLKHAKQPNEVRSGAKAVELRKQQTVGQEWKGEWDVKDLVVDNEGLRFGGATVAAKTGKKDEILVGGLWYEGVWKCTGL